QARFVGADAVTGGDWPGVYGLGGYWLPGTLNYKLLPETVTVVTTQRWVDYGDSGLPRSLRRPDTFTRTFSFWEGPPVKLQMRLNDGHARRISIYNYSGSWTNPVTFAVQDARSGVVLDAQTIARQDVGTYLTWEIEGEVVLQITSPFVNNPVFVNGIFIDAIPQADDPYNEWRRGYFTLLEQLDPAISGQTADPDADGYNNWTEFLLGRHPRTTETWSPLWFEGQPPLLHVLTGAAAAATDVTVQTSADLRNWTAATDLQFIEQLDHGHQLERVYRVHSALSTLHSQLSTQKAVFFRLKFQPPRL
ncbi:MAG: hypothetical protein L0Y58_05590, partial [Verrucomicrobia subdivision 3 bacterium]|nr:hypothetical protein [Limisphaerales bacterium]